MVNDDDGDDTAVGLKPCDNNSDVNGDHDDGILEGHHGRMMAMNMNKMNKTNNL